MRAVPDARLGQGRIGDNAVLLVQPQTFMNRSGQVVAPLVNARADQLVAIYDDLDLPPGRLRVRVGGGAGGHRGVASVIEHCGADFCRVRIGIGRPPAGVEVADFVLSAPPDGEAALLAVTTERAAAAVETLIEDGAVAAMNRFNVMTVPAPSAERP